MNYTFIFWFCMAIVTFDVVSGEWASADIWIVGALVTLIGKDIRESIARAVITADREKNNANNNS